jgi:biotin carboxyl carrier protein
MSKSILHISGVRYEIDDSRSLLQRIDGLIPSHDIKMISENEFSIIIDGHSCHLFLSRMNGTVHATIRNTIVEVIHETFRNALLKQLQRGTETSSTSFTLRAPMPGMIAKIIIAEGTEVRPGDGILVVEAMKMENEIKAPKAGILKKIFVSERQSVEKNDQLFTVEYI